MDKSKYQSLLKGKFESEVDKFKKYSSEIKMSVNKINTNVNSLSMVEMK